MDRYRRHLGTQLALASLLGFSLLAQAVPTERTTSYTYHPTGTNGAGLIATMDGPRLAADVSDVTSYAYDASGNLTTITNPMAHVTQLSNYNGRGLPGTVTDANGVETLLTYHVRGWLETSTVKHPGSSAALDAPTAFTYDAVGQVTRITLPDNSYLDFEYDDAQRLTAIQNNLLERIEYTLDAAGNRTQEVIKNSTGGIVKTQTRVFDELSRLMDDVGANNQTTHYDYDSNDNPTQITDGRLNATGQAFDALNRLVTQTDPDNFDVVYTYDSQDRIKTVTDQRGLVTTYNYDAFDNLTSLVSPDTGTTTYDYDEAGNRIMQTDARGVVANYTYDALNRLLTVSYPASPAENVTYTYDSIAAGNYGKGRLTQLSDESGIISFKYDHRGNLIEKSYNIETQNYSLSYAYDLADNLTRITYPSGRIVNYSRDSAGRVSGITTQENAGAGAQTLLSSVSYLPFGPMSGYSFGNGMTQTINYDQDYRITDIDSLGTSTLLDLNYNYDPNSNIDALNDLDDLANNQSFQYDKLNRLKQAIGNYGQLDYQYDGVGNRTQRIDANDGTPITEIYSYPVDSNQLDQVTSDDGTNQTQRSFLYDDNGNLIKDTKADGAVLDLTYNKANRYTTVDLDTAPRAVYLYNALGQRTMKVAVGSANTISDHYHYDELGQLLVVTNETGALKREYIYLDGIKVATLVDDAYATEWDQFDGAAQPSVVVVDNQDANTSQTGTWTVSSASGGYNGQSVYSDSAGTFRWTPTVAATGSYDVYAWWTYHVNRSTTVPYTVSHANGSDVVTVNQNDQALGGQWVLLGTYDFNAGSSHFIEVSSANGQAAADAVKLEPASAGNQPPVVIISSPVDGSTVTVGDSVTLSATATDQEDGDLSAGIQWSSSLDGSLGSGSQVITSALTVGSHTLTAEVTDSGNTPASDTLVLTVEASAPPAVTLIVDNQDANTSQTGTWTVSSASGGYNGQSVFSDSAGTFRWTPAVPSAGDYRVYAWWTYHANRSTTVPYTISHGGGSNVVTVNQHDQALGGQWVLLGTYSFNAGSTHYVEVSSVNGQAAADAVKLESVTTAGNQTPVVTISSPVDSSTVTVGDSVTLAATATDAEDGDLGSSISWSSNLDGALGTGIQVITSTLSIGVHTLTASATDLDTLTGTDTVTLTVQAVPNDPPQVIITSPANNSSFTQGASVTLQGTATDTEDGDLGSSIAWSSNLDGALGTGIQVATTTLSVGTHTITASVTDSGGEPADATLTLSITGSGGGGTTTVYTDDLETDQGWTVNPNGTDTATLGLWEIAVPQETVNGVRGVAQVGQAKGGTQALVTDARISGAGVGAYDIDGGVTSIRSVDINLPSLNIGESVELSFWYYLSHSNTGSIDDYLRVTVVGASSSTVVLEELATNNYDRGSWSLRVSNLDNYAGETIHLLIEAADAAAGSIIEAGIDEITIAIVTPPVFEDNFDTDKGWTANPAGTDTATTGQWERAVPEGTNNDGDKQLAQVVSGTQMLVTAALAGGSAGGDHDVDGGVTSIRSPDIVLPTLGAGESLELSLAYYLAHNSTTAEDYLRITVVGSTNTMVLEELGEAGDDSAFWELFTGSLDSFAGQTVHLLIEAADAGASTLIEAGIDRVKVELKSSN